jgi:hypothetical protein
MFTTLIETAVQEATQLRRAEVERIVLALRSRHDSKRAGAYHPTENVHAESQQRSRPSSARCSARQQSLWGAAPPASRE